MGKLFREFNEEKIQQIKTHPYFEGLVDAILKQAEINMTTEPPRIKFSQIHLYVTTGNREIFQRVYENYEARLRNLFLAYIFTEDEKYIEPLADIMWNICDMESWSIPAHVGEHHDIMRRRQNLDLTSTILGFRIAEILYYIGNKLPELVRRRAEYEVRERVIEAYKKYDGKTFWWMDCENNWASVCIGATFCVFAYLATKEETDALLPRMCATADGYLRGFDDDGCCKEGYGYWHYGFSYFCLFASMVRDYTDGEIDYFKDPKVHQIALFQQNATINEKELISFSDAGRYFGPGAWLSHFLKNEYSDMEIPSLKCQMNVSGGLRYIFWMRPEFADSQMNPKSHIFHDNQWFIHRSDAYNFACKAGHNAEPHNHNDVGSFVISKNGKVTFTDPGTGEYTRQYFSGERYNLIACSSRGHSVPIINGQYQVTGRNASTIITEEPTEYGFTYEKSYNVPTLTSLKREFKCEEDALKMVDTYEFSEQPESIVERFVSLVPMEETADGIKCGDSLLVYDKGTATASFSTEGLMRAGHREETVYILDLTLNAPAKNTVFSIEIR